MDSNKRDNGIDDILEELKKRPAHAQNAAGKSVDAILLEMGKGEKKSALLSPPPPQIAAKLQPQPAEPPTPAQPAPETEAAPPAVTEAPAQEEATATPAPPAPPQEEAWPLQEEEAPPPAPPPTQEEAWPQQDDAWAEAEEVWEAEEQAEEEPEEEPTPVEEPPKKKRRGKDLSATIYDIDLEAERVDIGPRVGKAAALDKVDPEKYSGDTELLSWFTGEDDGPMPTSKKEQKKAEKMKKRRLAAEKRAEKRRKRLGEDYAEAPAGEEEDTPAYAEEDTYEEDVVTGSAFEQDAADWEPGDEFDSRDALAYFDDEEERGPTRPVNQADTAATQEIPDLGPEDDPMLADTQEIDPPATVSQKTGAGSQQAAPPARQGGAPGLFAGEDAPLQTGQLDAVTPEKPAGQQQAPTTQKPPAQRPAPATQELPAQKQPLAGSDAGATRAFVPPAAAVDATPTLGFDAQGAAAATLGFESQQPQETAPEETGEPTLGFGSQIVYEDEDDAADYGSFIQGEEDGGDAHDTRSFELDAEDGGPRVPTAAYTQEFDENGLPLDDGSKNLYVDEMVDDRFRQFFSETVIVEEGEEEPPQKSRRKGKRKKSRSAVLTGEFAKLAEQAERAERAEQDNLELESDDDFEDYNRLQDAEEIEEDIASLCTTLTRRTVITGILGVALFWLSLGFSDIIHIPKFMNFAENPIVFTSVYIALILVAIVINFTTIATGLVGLVREPTVDSPPALAAVAGLLQGVLLLVQVLTKAPASAPTLFGGLVGFILAFNALGKRVRAVSILRNFQLASAGFDHSAAYVVDNSTELAYSITKGLQEEYPYLLVSRPTALVKGFLRQSFSQRATDRRGRLLGWILLGVALLAGVLTWALGARSDLLLAFSAFTAVLCIGAPFSSALVSGVPSLLLQKGTSRVGAVVPGWSAIEELGNVNVVMAGAKDIFPTNVVSLKGIKTFEKERIDLAILYAASVLVEGCDTLKDIFMAVIQGKSDMLYRVESLTREPGRGFTAWVQSSRVVIGTREMLQKHDIEPPPIEIELKYVPQGFHPVYLAVSGKLFAMFIVGYKADSEVQETLDSLVKSGVSLLIESDDMNVTAELVESTYNLPAGVVKVLGRRELDMLEPLTDYQPNSEGVLTHMGTFASFIGGMRAAASCAASEKMASVVQLASVLLACALCLLLVFSQALAVLSPLIAVLYQLGWTLLVSALPFALRY